MAAAGSWPSIEAHGLLSTSRLLELWRVSPPEWRESLLHQRRPRSLVISDPVLGDATIRDQIPLDPRSLEEALTDMTAEEWIENLNGRVFFFLQRQRLESLVNARSYKNHEQTVLTMDTAAVVGRYGPQIELCRMNSGFAQPHSKARRGSSTFLSISDFYHPNRDAPRERPQWDVHELTVPLAVADVLEFVVQVDRVKGEELIETIYRRQ